MLIRREIVLAFFIGAASYLVIGFQESIRRETLCTGREPVVLNCSDDRVISIEKTESENYKCNLGCDTMFLERVKVLCNGYIACKVTSDIFPDQCNLFSRHLRTYISCKYWSGTDNRSFDVCSNKLSKIHCDNYFWEHRIRFQSVAVKSELQCDNEANNRCLLDRLKSLCNEREYCSEEVADNSCLFENQYMHIYYSCPESSRRTQTNTTIEVITPVTLDIFVTSTKNIFTESPESSQENNMVALNGRLLVVKYELSDLNHVLCSDLWNDKAASVVCKFLNFSKLGRAIHLTNPENYGVINISLNCTGQEGSLQDCDFIESPCSSTMVAGVICCDDKIDCQNQMPTTAILPSSQKSIGKTGLIVGIVVSLVLVCLVVIGTLFCLKRFNFFKTNESEVDNPRFRTEMGEANENQNYDCLERRNPNDHIYDVRFDATNPTSSDMQGVANENQNYDCLERRNPNDHIYDVRFDATNQTSSDVQGAVYTSIDYEEPIANVNAGTR